MPESYVHSSQRAPMPRALDGFPVRRPQAPRRSPTASSSPPMPVRPTPVPTPAALPRQHTPLRTASQRWTQRLKTAGRLLGRIILVIGLLACGLLVRYPGIGQAFVGVYALFALVRRVESRTTFTLGLMALGVVLVASIRSDTVLASAFSLYAFLLLVVGVVTLGRELHEEI